MNLLNNKIKVAFFSIVLVFSLFSNLFAEEEKSKQDAYNKLKVFSEVLSLIESNYVEPVENDSMIEGAISGMVKSLDPHTSYMPPASYKEMQVETTGKFGGLGIEISIRDGILTVVSPIEETPAFRVGNTKPETNSSLRSSTYSLDAPDFIAFSSRPSSSSHCPTSAAIAMTSHP